MGWIEFALIQLVLITVAAGALRLYTHRRRRSHNDALDLAQEVLHLRAANELLQAQLRQSQTDRRSAGPAPDVPADPEHLKELLQQFTRDSHDMLACIEELERETRDLRARLTRAEQNGAFESPLPETP